MSTDTSTPREDDLQQIVIDAIAAVNARIARHRRIIKQEERTKSQLRTLLRTLQTPPAQESEETMATVRKVAEAMLLAVSPVSEDETPPPPAPNVVLTKIRPPVSKILLAAFGPQTQDTPTSLADATTRAYPEGLNTPTTMVEGALRHAVVTLHNMVEYPSLAEEAPADLLRLFVSLRLPENWPAVQEMLRAWGYPTDAA